MYIRVYILCTRDNTFFLPPPFCFISRVITWQTSTPRRDSLTHASTLNLKVNWRKTGKQVCCHRKEWSRRITLSLRRPLRFHHNCIHRALHANSAFIKHRPQRGQTRTHSNKTVQWKVTRNSHKTLCFLSFFTLALDFNDRKRARKRVPGMYTLQDDATGGRFSSMTRRGLNLTRTPPTQNKTFVLFTLTRWIPGTYTINTIGFKRKKKKTIP